MAAEGLLEGSRKGGMRGQGDLPSVSVVKVTGRNKEGYLVRPRAPRGDLLDGPQTRLSKLTTARRAIVAIARRRPYRRATPHWHGCGASIRTNILPASFANWAMPVGKLSAWCASAVMAYGSFRLTAANAMIINWKKTLKRRMAICWSAKNSRPRMAAKRARMKENIGAADDPHAFSLISIAEQGLPTVFPEAVMAEAEAVEEAGLEGREDLTVLPFITIDPADARDHDDAVFAEPDPDIRGLYRLGGDCRCCGLCRR